MGIDLIAGGRIKNGNRKKEQTDNVYIKLLVKLYRFLARRTSSQFNNIVLKRLFMSRVNRPPISLGRVQRYSKGKADKTIVVVGTVTDDPRLLTFPALTVCALRFTTGARARVVKAGGECITFDQLALRAPTGTNTILLRGRKNASVATRYFGAAGTPGSKTRPRIESKGRKFETARGRKASKGYKN